MGCCESTGEMNRCTTCDPECNGAQHGKQRCVYRYYKNMNLEKCTTCGHNSHEEDACFTIIGKRMVFGWEMKMGFDAMVSVPNDHEVDVYCTCRSKEAIMTIVRCKCSNSLLQ